MNEEEAPEGAQKPPEKVKMKGLRNSLKEIIQKMIIRPLKNSEKHTQQVRKPMQETHELFSHETGIQKRNQTENIEMKNANVPSTKIFWRLVTTELVRLKKESLNKKKILGKKFSLTKNKKRN